MADSIIEQVEEAARRGTLRAIEEREGTREAAAALEREAEGGIQLWKPYTVKEVAPLLGISESRVYDIPPDQLRPTWTGPTKGRKCFLGINVICYLAGLEPVDVEAIARRVRERFLADAREPQKVKAMKGAGKHRVL